MTFIGSKIVQKKLRILNTLPFGELYGVEVAHVPTAALLRSLQWVSLYRSRSAEPAAHTQSAGRSWARGYGWTSKKVKQALFSYKNRYFCDIIQLVL